MNSQQQTKKFLVTSPTAIVDNASWTCNVIDTLGYDYCDIDILLGVTDIAMATLKVQGIRHQEQHHGIDQRC